MRKRRKRPNLNTSIGDGGQFFPGVQKKLAVGQPGDAFEVEADKMADTVVSGTESGAVQKKETEDEIQQKPLAESISSVQKKDMPAEEETVQKMEEEEAVQKKSTNVNTYATNGTETTLKQQKGMGNKMDTHTQNEMERGFGADFNKVNIHSDSTAEKLSSQLGAQAFTHGNDIYFNKGKYNPNSTEGKHLLAHELTHTIQQNGSKEQVNRAPEEANTSQTCEGKEDISDLFKMLAKDANTIIDGAEDLSTDEKKAKKSAVTRVLSPEGVFSTQTTTFFACDKINLPGLDGASENGFNGYSDEQSNEIGMLKNFKADIAGFVSNKDMDALLRVLKLVAHEKTHMNIKGAPIVAPTDLQEGSPENAAALSSYYVEEILVNAEEIVVNYYFTSGDYDVPHSLSKEIHDYWKKITAMLTLEKAEEMKQFIVKYLEQKYSSKNKENAISIGIINAMERGNWRANPMHED
ncbi:eCIS core domain-containing protein [Flavivirga jejuensis]|uniref:DUF4157 domain-containing protein n=1 Tax=Flavivirga jejuensis TaxID=870487 RepID=A0ABT8WQL4_9FLAO|nr:DUF4157 domain-containing protein [Flavivirga jejuensis]MDO5975207.1 DUF4157 domain-containing protein [Flavivirga jejuensis]